MRVAPIFVSAAALAMAIWIACAGRPSGGLYIETNPARVAESGGPAGQPPAHKWRLRERRARVLPPLGCSASPDPMR